MNNDFFRFSMFLLLFAVNWRFLAFLGFGVMNDFKTRPTVTNVSVYVSVCVSVTTMSYAKTAEPIEMLFETEARWAQAITY